MPRSNREQIEALDVGDAVSPKELAQIVMQDPVLALRLLRRAKSIAARPWPMTRRRSLGAVQQVGLRGIRCYAAVDSPLCDDANVGLQGCGGADGCFRRRLHCTGRPTVPTFLRKRWRSRRCSAKWANWMLWAFISGTAATRARRTEAVGRATRNVHGAQQQRWPAFSFKQLSVSLIETWALPPLIMQLVKEPFRADTLRANIAPHCFDAARHLQANRAIRRCRRMILWRCAPSCRTSLGKRCSSRPCRSTTIIGRLASSPGAAGICLRRTSPRETVPPGGGGLFRDAGVA